MAWAIRQQIVTDPAARHVLQMLANYADQDGRDAFPSVATLSRDTGLSVRTVQAKLSALLAADVIGEGDARLTALRYRADRAPKVYDLTAMQRDAGAAPRARGATAAPRCGQVGGQVASRGATDDVTGCNPLHHGVRELHPNQKLLTKSFEPEATAVVEKLSKPKPRGTKREGEHLRTVSELLATGEADVA